MSSSVDDSVDIQQSLAIHEIGVVVDRAVRPGGKTEIVVVTTCSEGLGDPLGASASSTSSRYIPILSGIRDRGDRGDGGDLGAGPDTEGRREGTRGLADDGARATLFQTGRGDPDAMKSANLDCIVLGVDPPVSAKPTSCFHASLGCLEGRRWVGSAKNKLWWMTPSWGTLGGDVPLETQFLLVELGEGEGDGEGDGEGEGEGGPQRQREGGVGGNEGEERRLYACLLPLICDGAFTGMLAGGDRVTGEKGSGHGRNGARFKQQRYVTYIF